MAALLTITLLLLCSSVTGSEGKCDYNVATGGNFTVPLDQRLKGLKKLQWKHNNINVFDGRIKDEKISVVFGKEKDISPNGSLKLTNMDKTKAGTYTPEVYDTDGRNKILDGKSVCVFDRVPKPKVTFQCGPKSESQVTFSCNFKPEEGLQIEWLKNKNLIKNEKTKTLKQDGEKVERDSFTCTVSNAVSSMTSEPVIQTCFKAQFSFLYDEVMGVAVWIIIASGGGVVLLLILTIVVCCIMNKRKRRMNLKDEEELRLDWTNTEQQQHHHPPHNQNHKHHHHSLPLDHQQHQQHQHQQQQQPGHTGPRQNRSRQQREPRPRLPEPPGGPQPSPRRAAQGPGPAATHDDEQPPPLPQPRKKAQL